MSAPQIRIKRELTAAGGRYVARLDGVEGEAELTFARPAAETVVALHTFAPPTMRGTGAAKALVDRLVADARAEGFRIASRCSYVSDQLRRHPEWSDVIG